MEIIGNSDVGKTRQANEDSFRFGHLSDGAIWAVVCDGMGGAVAGEVASRIAADLVAEKIQLCYRKESEIVSIRNILASAITTANVAIFDKAVENENLAGMGTTIVACIIKDGMACFAHVGDSRAYIIRKDDILQITKDHSLVQVMLDAGRITIDEFENSSMRNIIVKCLGQEEKLENDYIEFNVLFFDEGDAFVLCSDGLSSCVKAQTIFDTVKELPLEKAVNTLINEANSNGGYDNITVVGIR